MRTITFDVCDPVSINLAIQELKMFQSEFRQKCTELRQKIAMRVAWRAATGFRTAQGNDIIKGIWPSNNNVDVTVTDWGTFTVVIADGPEAVFIEFGAGVYHNGPAGDSPHPWGIQNGYTIGSYGQHKGVRNAWNITKDVVTRGTPADMPMYRGAEEAIRALDDIVKDVFR